jgi:hypothetical protein
VSIPEHAPPSLGNGLNELWLNLFGHPESHFFANTEESSAAGPSSSSPPSGPADGWTGLKQPLPSIPEEPSPASIPEHAPPSPGNGLNELWLNLFGHPESHFFANTEESSAARPSSSSPPLGPTDGSTGGVKQPQPSIPEEPSPVSSEDHAPPSSGSLTQSGYELMKGGEPPGPSGPASSTMSSADHKLMGAVSSTNLDRQSMGADSPSGKRRKTVKGLWFATTTSD